MDIFQKGMHALRLFNETDLDQTDLNDFMLRKLGYTMQDVDLPPKVLRNSDRENTSKPILKQRSKEPV